MTSTQPTAHPMTPPPPLVIGPLTRTDLVRYAGASGDFNPIHHDEGFARDAGLPAPLSLGMLQAGMLASWATDWLGPENIRRFRVRFADRVFPGDTVTCSGRVAAATDDTVELELECVNQDGTVVLRAWAAFALGIDLGLRTVDGDRTTVLVRSPRSTGEGGAG